MILSSNFKRFSAPETGRTVVQLTTGDSLNYPLYYFIPSITKDNRYLIYHKVINNNVQLFRLDLSNGEDICITDAKAQNTLWYPWCVNKGSGVLDHRSVLNLVRNAVIYFDDNDVLEVDVDSLQKKLLFTIPKDRVAIGQNCVTTDGQWFVYIHHDRKLFEEIAKTSHQAGRNMSRNTALCAYNFETGEHRDLLFMNSPIHHVIPYDETHVVFCHPATEDGMLFTSIDGGYCTHLRTMDKDAGTVCHYVVSKKGIMYEVLGSKRGRVFAGIYNPHNHNRYEFALPEYFGYTHTGCDEEGKIWFYENYKQEHSDGGTIHDLHFLVKHDSEKGDKWIKLFGNWTTYLGGQSSHFHPRITPDRKWIIFTGGDREYKKNQIYLLDISDIEETYGIPEV